MVDWTIISKEFFVIGIHNLNFVKIYPTSKIILNLTWLYFRGLSGSTNHNYIVISSQCALNIWEVVVMKGAEHPNWNVFLIFLFNVQTVVSAAHTSSALAS